MSGFYGLYRAVRRVNSFCIGLSCVAIGLIVLLTVWETITRYFFRQPAVWTYPVTSYLLLYCIYLGVAYTLQRGGHVSVDFLLELLTPRPRRWLLRFGHLLGLAFTLVFLQQAYRLFFRHATEGQRDISTLSVPLALGSGVLFAGVVLLVVTYVLVLIDSFLRGPNEPTLQELERVQADAALEVEAE